MQNNKLVFPIKNLRLGALASLLFLPIFLSAQKTEGEITYKETIHLDIQLGDGPEAEEMRKMMPSERSIAKTLFFSSKESLYKDAELQAEGDGNLELNSQGDGGDVQIKFDMSSPDNRIYRNLAEGKSVESQEFFGRQFLIQDDTRKLSWKISGEQKQIQGFMCQKAMLQDSARKVEAWFAPTIPVSAGPSEFQGLPGLILEINAENGERKIVAEKIDLKALDKKTIEKPTKGKSVTREEFKKIRDEKLKEMGAEPGGGGGAVRVIIRN